MCSTSPLVSKNKLLEISSFHHFEWVIPLYGSPFLSSHMVVTWSSPPDVQYPSVMDWIRSNLNCLFVCCFFEEVYWLKTNHVVVFRYLCSWCHNNQQNTDCRHFLWNLWCKCTFRNPKFHHYMYHGCYKATLSHLDKLTDTEKQSFKI